MPEKIEWSVPRLVQLLFSVLWTFWLGGFSFYLAVVVPIGGRAIGPDTQGLVTADVTLFFNYGGIVVGALWLIPHWQPLRLRRYRQLCAILLIGLSLWLCFHRLDVIGKMNGDSVQFVPSDWSFYGIHRLYIWLTLWQWLNAVALFIALQVAKLWPQPASTKG